MVFTFARNVIVALFLGSIYYDLGPKAIMPRSSLALSTIAFVSSAHIPAIPQ